jgi:hypothetical protein
MPVHAHVTDWLWAMLCVHVIYALNRVGELNFGFPKHHALDVLPSGRSVPAKMHLPELN